jgi:hypothetical protein
LGVTSTPVDTGHRSQISRKWRLSAETGHPHASKVKQLRNTVDMIVSSPCFAD